MLKPKKGAPRTTAPLTGKRCELCTRRLSNNAQDTVCEKCDRQLELRFMKEERKLDLAWAKKWRCQECNRGLTRDRARLCHSCLPNDERETECAWDMVPKPPSTCEVYPSSWASSPHHRPGRSR